MAKLLSGTRIYGTATVDTQVLINGGLATSSTATGSLQVFGGAGISGSVFVGGVVTATTYYGTFAGTLGGTVTVTTATNIAGGTAGQLHYQSAPGITAFAGPGTAGQLLLSNGAAAPVYTNTASVYVGAASSAVNLFGGAAGSLVYQSAANATTTLPISATAGAVLVSNGSTAPAYIASVMAQAGTGDATAYGTQSLKVSGGGAGIVGDSWFSNNVGIGGTLKVSSANYNTATNSSNALYVVGGIYSDGGLTVGAAGPVLFKGPVTFAGTATYVLSTNTYYTDNIIEMHTPPGGVYANWFLDDGKDIGFRFHYFTNSTDTNAALVLANDTKYLEWYSAGAESTGSAFTSATYGTFKTGAIKLASGLPNSNNTSSGDLQVLGGVGIGQNLYVQGSITVLGTINASVVGIITSATNIANGTAGQLHYQSAPGVTAFAGPGSYGQFLMSTGASAPVYQSTLTQVNGNIIINTTASTYSTTTGALQIAGGVGIGGGLVLGGAFTSTGNITVISPQPEILFNDTVTGRVGEIGVNDTFNLYVNATNGGGYLILNSPGSGGGNRVGINNINPGYTLDVTGTISAYNTLYASSTTSVSSTNTGALQVAGGVGVGGSLYVGGVVTATTYYGTFAGTIGGTVIVTTATNIAGGTAGQLNYQSAPGITAFAGPGTAGQLLVSAGASAPVYTNTSSIYVNRATLADSATTATNAAYAYSFNTATLVATAVTALSVSGTVSTSSQVLAQAQSAASTYYPTFVNANNASATASSIYTTSSFTINPSTRTVNIGNQAPQGAPSATDLTANATLLLSGTGGNYLGFGQYAAGQGFAQWIQSAYQNPTTAAYNLVLQPLGGSVLVNATSLYSGEKFAVNGGGYFNGIVTATTYYGTFAGTIGGSVTISTATNVAGGTAGQLHYQSAPGVTAFAGPGTAGQILVSNGASAPVYTNTASIGVGFVANALSTGTGILGGTYNGSVAQTWSLNTATLMNLSLNVAGGATGSLLYQSAANATTSLALGTAGYVLTAGASAPQWTAISGLSAGSAAQITTAPQTASATYYPIFVSSNAAGNQAVYTTSTFSVNPATGQHNIGGSLYIGGDLFVDGQNFIVNTNTISSGDKALVLSTGSTSAALAVGAGIYIGATSSTAYTSFYYDGSANWVVGGSAGTGLKSANHFATSYSSVGSYTSSQKGEIFSVNGGAYVNGIVTATTFVGNLSGTSAGTSAALTINSGGAGAVSGTTFNGSSAVTISYNTIGSPSTTGANASGQWGIYTQGIRQSDGTAWLTQTNAIGSSGARGTDLAPNTYNYGISSEFKNSSLYSFTGNYTGLITYAPWLGTTASTGDPSYQLAFSPSAASAITTPSLKFRAGIDTTWGAWQTMIHSGNISSYSAGSTTAALTFNNGGTGDASGTTFNGSTARTISYNTLGASPLAGSTSLVTVGTITAGTWNGTILSPTYGGTGVNNGANTLTVTANSSINQDVRTTASVTHAGATINGTFTQGSGFGYLGQFNTNGTSWPTLGSQGVAFAWNHSAGSAESNIWNANNPATYTGTGLRFMQLLTASTHRDLMFLRQDGALAFGGTGNIGSSGQVLQSNGAASPTWVNASGITAGGTTASLTMNNSGSGDASGTVFNGSTARTLSYNTIGAMPYTGGTFTGAVTHTGAGLFLNRNGSPTSGLSWYSSSYTAWSSYMAAGGATSSGPTANITASTGAYVTSWALRNFTENLAGYGFVWESGTSSGQPSPVAELRASDGLFHAYGNIYKYNSPAGGYMVPAISISDTAPSGTVSVGDMWWQSSTGRLKIRYFDGTNTQWVDVVPVIDTSLFFSKSGGAISGPVSINGTLDVTGNITATAEITAYYSDRRLKTDIVTIENALVKVKKLNGVTYRPNELAKSFGLDTNSDVVGLFADEVEEVLPQAVKPAPFDTDENGNSKSGENYKTIQYEKVVPLLVEAIKEQQTIIDNQNDRITRLEELVNQLLNK